MPATRLRSWPTPAAGSPGTSPLSCRLTRVTRDKGALAQDDRLDALAIGVAHFSASTAADMDKAVQRARDRLRDQELRRFAQHVLGHRPRVPVWAGTP